MHSFESITAVTEVALTKTVHARIIGSDSRFIT